MLIELRIRNYAVIEDLDLSLGAGLSALTGETGAGKSIIVGALSLLLGERASSEVVRAGAARATVEGVFQIGQAAELRALLAEQGVDLEDDLLILRREVAAEGRNRAWVNGAAATASLVGRLGALLVDLHGQHEHQSLLRAEEQRSILDAYAGALELAQSVHALHAQLLRTREALHDLERRRREAQQRTDLLRFQIGEIEAARLAEGEDERVAEELHRLEHADELARSALRLNQALYADENSVTSRLGELRRTMEHILRIDGSQTDARELLESARYTLEEVASRMLAYAEGLEQDPVRLEEARRRSDLLFRLKSKYGPQLSDVLEFLMRAKAELAFVEGGSEEEEQLSRAEGELVSQIESLARELTQRRTEAAGRLVRTMEEDLPALGLPGSRFEVSLDPLGEVGSHGAERVEFRVSLNAGFEPKPLARVASGGELSRVMLALKTAMAEADRVPTLVFDEVDAGIGGRVAADVASRLCEVSRRHQVFVVTHLAQIAARADHQLYVEKREDSGVTRTEVRSLDDEARVLELARMLGGDPESAVSLEHARELLAR